MTLGLVDFLADGLSIKKTALGKLALCLMVFVPPLILAEIYSYRLPVGFRSCWGPWRRPSSRLTAHHHGCRRTLLSPHPRPQLLPGGIWTLLLLVIFVVVEVIIEITHLVARV